MSESDSIEILTEFIVRLTREIPCHYHPRKRSKGISLKKYNTMKHGAMGHFATVYDKPKKGYFEIITKEWLADSKCKEAAILGRWGYGTEPDGTRQLGLIFHVTKGSKGKDYQQALSCLKVIINKS